MLVSHDFRLLQQTARTIWIVDQGKVTPWAGDIASYVLLEQAVPRCRDAAMPRCRGVGSRFSRRERARAGMQRTRVLTNPPPLSTANRT